MATPGQPTKYRPEYCQQIIDLMEQGKTLTQFAATLRVTRETIYEWMKVHPEFSDAVKTARICQQAHWENLMHGLTTGEIHGNATIAVWYTKNAFPECYRDRYEVEATIHDVIGSREENIKAIQQLTKKLKLTEAIDVETVEPD